MGGYTFINQYYLKAYSVKSLFAKIKHNSSIIVMSGSKFLIAWLFSIKDLDMFIMMESMNTLNPIAVSISLAWLT
ncbi:MAG TPA: hypothetical protein VF084_08335 [Nitrososphaeraceae archaeon]